MSKPIRAVFFDIGGTLGVVDLQTKTLTPFSDTVDLLRSLLKVSSIMAGVITNIPDDWTTKDAETMLAAAGILPFLDQRGLITSQKAHANKPDVHIYQFAADQLGVETSECLFIDDDVNNVTGACKAGMSAVRKAPH
ncbi:MAG TPA: HAD-IA family hydrolase [Terriglobia bacterium]|nr:HAD-IA family hydrolase [Terriglobia bacterium]